jgi:imidazolonepropionase-like amidohydrolase
VATEQFIRVGTLIDGSGNEATNDKVVTIRDGRFADIADAASSSIPSGAEVIDASELTVMPGLIDAHTHIHTPGGPIDNYALAQLKGTVGKLSLETYKHALTDLAMGYTSIRSLSSPSYVDIAVRDIIDSGVLPGPRLRVAGQGLTATGGHMDKGWWSPDLSVPGRTGVCDGPWEARKAARTQLKWGADVLKINPCVGDYRNLETPWRQEMTFEEISVICEEAHWAGKTVAAHTAGGQGITDSIRAGVNSLEHAHWLTDEQIEMMVKAGTFYVPTLIVNTRSVELGADAKDIGSDGWNWLEKVYKDKWETLRRAKDAGVKIAAGTDAGFVVPHGENALEILELVKGGFTVMEALVAATQTAAECLKMGDQVGSIQAGKRADFILVNGDVLADPSVLLDRPNIVAVYKDGVKMATAL